MLKLGQIIKPYGKVSAIGYFNHELPWLRERYYFFVDKHGTVSMISASVVEPEEAKDSDV